MLYFCKALQVFVLVTYYFRVPRLWSPLSVVLLSHSLVMCTLPVQLFTLFCICTSLFICESCSLHITYSMSHAVRHFVTAHDISYLYLMVLSVIATQYPVYVISPLTS